MKVCTRCNQNLEENSFYGQIKNGKNNKKWAYHDPMCKPCRSDYTKERKVKLKEQIVEYLGGKCADCGLVDHPVAYDCHHLDPSQKDFSIANTSRTFEHIKPELDKCVLLCAICHRKRHAGLDGTSGTI